ncbi:MAG: carotenoid oxygenase family protein [Halioglobus sp.]|nr:carotenoid oxygenase family protein [Halioglobus sp.]
MNNNKSFRTLNRRQFVEWSGIALAGAGLPLGLVGCSDSSDSASGTAGAALPVDPQGRWWLSGNYAPVLEERDVEGLAVSGELPQSLHGLYVRNGSNQEDIGHWFNGHGMLHGVRFQNGEASLYRNRYVRTKLFLNPDLAPNPTDIEANPSNVSVIHHGGKLLSLGEVGLPYEIGSDSLETAGSYDFDGALNGWMTAHPKIHPDTGELLFFGYSVVNAPYLTYYRANAAGEIVQAEHITVPAPVMMHDFAATENYVLFYDLPVVFSLDEAIAGNPLPFGWDPDHIPRIGIMPQRGGDNDVIWFPIDPCFVFHTLNAYEDPGNPREIVLHASRLDAPFWEDNVQDFSRPSWLYEWRFNLDTGSLVSAGRLLDAPFDFGQVNRNVWGKPYRYGYGLDFSERSTSEAPAQPVGIQRYDRHDGTSTQLNLKERDLVPDEALFVPAGAGGEDSGYLLSYAFNRRTATTDLLIIDAADIAAGPVATVHLPERVPHGFHGVWIPA